MSIKQMRTKIAKVYDNKKWFDRVSNMSDKQVMAIFFRFRDSGKFDKKEESPYKQMTVFDYI